MAKTYICTQCNREISYRFLHYCKGGDNIPTTYGPDRSYIRHTAVSTDDPIVNSVLDKFSRRSAIGMIKYNMSMANNPGDIIYWITNLQEELQDAILYAERLLQEIRKEKGNE